MFEKKWKGVRAVYKCCITDAMAVKDLQALYKSCSAKVSKVFQVSNVYHTEWIETELLYKI